MTTMVERVSKAQTEEVSRYIVAGADDHGYRVYDRSKDGEQRFAGTRSECLEWVSRAAARAAIDAMREPSEAMITAGWIDKEDVNPDEIWGAMIDAALSESTPTPAGGG